MNEETQALLRKAKRKLLAAESVLLNGFPEDTASDAYYAMYHAAKAILLNRAPRVKKHGDVIRKFSELLVETGRIDRKFAEYLEGSLRSRHFADYETDLTAIISPEDARDWLRKATEFVTMAEKFLEGTGGSIE